MAFDRCFVTLTVGVVVPAGMGEMGLGLEDNQLELGFIPYMWRRLEGDGLKSYPMQLHMDLTLPTPLIHNLFKINV